MRLGVPWRCVLAICLLVAGCSINEHNLGGSVSFYRNDSDTGRAVRVEVLGLRLATDRIEAGLHLGHVEQTLYYAGDNSSTDPRSVAEFAEGDHANMLRPVEDSEGRSWDLGTPLAISSRRIGIGLGVASGLRLQLGVEHRAALSLPSKSHLIVIQTINDTGSLPHGVHFTVKEYTP